MRQGVSQVHEGRIHRQLPIADRSVISLDQMRQRIPPRNRVLRNHIPKGHSVQVSSRSQRLVRRVALVIKEDPQGVLETLKTQKQLSHHRGVFTQIHLTSTLRIAGLTRKSTFYINAVQPSNRPNPLKRQSVPQSWLRSKSLVENRKLLWRLSPIADGRRRTRRMSEF